LRAGNDRLTNRDQLLRQQRAMTRRAFNHPHARRERFRPSQQPFALTTISRQRQFANQLFVAVDHRSCM
jgi:hypothetical protein